MEKENAPASTDREKDRPTPNLLDAASLFGGKEPRLVKYARFFLLKSR